MRRQLSACVLDVGVIAIATLSAQLVRHDFVVTTVQLGALLPYLTVTILLSAVVLPALGVCRSVWRLTALPDYLRLCAAVALVVAGTVVAIFVLNRLEGLPRSLPVLQALLALAFLVGVRILARMRHAARARPGQLQPLVDTDMETVLVLGLNRLTEAYIYALAEHNSEHIRIAGLLGDKARHIGRLAFNVPVLGSPEQLGDVLRSLEVEGVVIDRILVAMPPQRLSQSVRRTLRDLEENGEIRVEYLGDLLGVGKRSRSHFRTADDGVGDVEDDVTFSLDQDGLRAIAARPYWRIKRIFDATIALASLVVFAPIMMLVAFAVALDVGFPVVFAQQRPGLGGRPFRLIKFRTMGRAHDDEGRRVADGARLSAFGRFLRRSRLDELPQLFHVLVGEMSFVGPRPLLPIDQPPSYQARLLVRPGLTGWAQVRGGREVSAADKAALDVWYVQNASLALDLQVMLATVKMLIFGERVDHSDIDRAWRDLMRTGICRRMPDPTDVLDLAVVRPSTKRRAT